LLDEKSPHVFKALGFEQEGARKLQRYQFHAVASASNRAQLFDRHRHYSGVRVKESAVELAENAAPAGQFPIKFPLSKVMNI
jgi:hypothetical protein